MIESYRVGRSKSLTGYRFELTYDGVTYRAVSEADMGSVMAAQRELVRLICADQGQDIGETTGPKSDVIWLNDLTSERSVTKPGFVVEATSGRFKVTAYMDPSLESFLALWGGVMRFFGQKYGLVSIEPDATYNVQAMIERGMA